MAGGQVAEALEFQSTLAVTLAACLLVQKEFRFEGRAVFIRRDAATGEVILSRHPDSWAGLFALDKTTDIPVDFMSAEDRKQTDHLRDPFEWWEECATKCLMPIFP